MLLQQQPWVAKCLLAKDGREGADLARRHRPEVALLDITDAGAFVGSSAAALREAHPAMQILLTSRCAWSAEPSAPARELGAAGFVPPGAQASEIIAAVRRALLSQQPGEPAGRRDRSSHLTDRERQLLALISTGATNKEIAARLHLGPDSIKKSASGLYRRLGVRNRTEAARCAAEWLLSA
jgi:DNA-binding NarL/FixJ family response regulator